MVSSGWAQPDAPDQPLYLDVDVLLTGKEMLSFSSDGEIVNVVVGDFAMTVGQRQISGRDAVVWIKESRLGDQILRRIEVYVEGSADRPAKVVEPDGTTTTDREIYVTVSHRGAFRARVGAHGEGDARELPQFKRAVQKRKEYLAPRPASQPAPAGATGDDTTTVGPVVQPSPTLGESHPVSFRADTISSEEIPDPRDPKKTLRVSIAKGNVYISQGDPDSDLFLEVRADWAVIYTASQEAPEGELAENIVGAYLEGDVVMRRGDRTIRGNRLFYDFQIGRALILQPVLRSVQEQRNIPVYIRATEGRQTAARADPGARDLRIRGYQWKFKDALVTSSDFYSPGYHIGSRRVVMEDTSLYDAKLVRVSEGRWRTTLTNNTFNIGGLPVLWWPKFTGDVEEGHSALRKAQIGNDSRFGFGAETDWHLFRLLGVPRPEGFRGNLEADYYKRGFILGTRVRYDRSNYSGYGLAYGVLDNAGEDDFGTDRKNVPAQRERGRLLWRHKQFLPRDWQVQLEASYLCDRNFLEEYFPVEFWAGKPQENLLYAKKQRNNWALTVLTQWRLNDFLTTTESFPDVAGYLIGQSLWKNRLTYYGQGKAGVVRYRPDEALATASSSSTFRADWRDDLHMPFQLGPVKVVPFIGDRLTYWSQTPADGGLGRVIGRIGLNATTHIWRIYNDVDSRLWNLHRIKHVITPYGRVFATCANVQPDRVFPYSPNVEEDVRRLRGGVVGVKQIWQTKRGPADDRHTVDWLRIDMAGSFFGGDNTTLPADGRYFLRRPTLSLARNALNTNVAWQVSDATTLLLDTNFDVDSGNLAVTNGGVSVVRDPRLAYYLGVQQIKDLESTVGEFAVRYKIDRKYTVGLFQQYDFNSSDGSNQVTSLTLTRKFSRLYVSFTMVYERVRGGASVFISVWPEGISEIRLGGSRFTMFGTSDDN